MTHGRSALSDLGVVGLGRAFTLMLPTFAADPRVRLVAAADPRPEARARFVTDFGPAYDNAEAALRRPGVEAVYIASPHQMHAAHVRLAAEAGKHVLVEKPMAITLDECDAMIEAAARAGVHLIVGHSHSFNRPILRLRELIAQRRVRAGAHDPGAQLHRLPLSPAPAGGARSPRRAAA